MKQFLVGLAALLLSCDFAFGQGVTSVPCNQLPALTGTTTSTAGSCATSTATGTNLSTNPADPTGTTNTATGVMMGLGTTCKITPVVTGRLLVTWTGLLKNSVAADGTNAQARDGTGTAPVNGAANTGTARGNIVGSNPVNSATGWQSFATTYIGTGYALSTQVWLDLTVQAATGGTASISNVYCAAMEF